MSDQDSGPPKNLETPHSERRLSRPPPRPYVLYWFVGLFAAANLFITILTAREHGWGGLFYFVYVIPITNVALGLASLLAGIIARDMDRHYPVGLHSAWSVALPICAFFADTALLSLIEKVFGS